MKALHFIYVPDIFIISIYLRGISLGASEYLQSPMKLSEFKFGGKIIINEDIDFEFSLEEQVWSLNENILHVQYDSGLLLDIGWTKEFEVDGYFQVNIIKNGDWDDPVFRENFDFASLPVVLPKIINQVKAGFKL